MRYLRTIFLSVMTLCLISSNVLEAKCKRRHTADYVIVGVGTAGAVLAKKLSDDKKHSVIALHIGKNETEDPLIKFSAFAGITVISALFNSPFYQTGNTLPQVNADNRLLLWVMALPLGGASSINAGAYVRGTDQLYAQWETIAGPEWSVPRITETYKELENYNGQTMNPAVRGFHGPLNIFQDQHPSTVAQKFNQAWINATGFPNVLDYNDPATPIGCSDEIQYTEKGPDGVLRVSSATAFLNKKIMTPAGFGVNGRKLRVLFNSTGLKTIWDGNKAVGVEYLNNGKTKKVYARKGVIVSTGLKSSTFLLHSGVGPRALLESLGIPVVFDNPNVGQGLADQTRILLIYTSKIEDSNVLANGVFTQFSMLPSPTGDQNSRQLRFAAINPLPGITAALFDLVQPLSRGSITINSPDPLAPPVINIGILSNPNDLTTYQEGFQTYIRNFNAALQAIDPDYQMVFPEPAVLDDINLLTNFIRDNVDTDEHFQSHCRMAPLDQGGVVDSTGHVYGVQNLIVADNSIVPQDMDGSPMATAYLIAANIARLLLQQ